MSTPADHLEEARLNRAFAESLLADPTGDPLRVQWAVTLAFYCAVHCMQAHLLRLGIDPKTHAARAYWIDHPVSGVPRRVRRAYAWLKSRSEHGRYSLGRFAPAFVRQRVLDDQLKTITDFASL